MKKIISIIALAVIAFTFVGCESLNRYEYVEGKVNIVTTTTMLGDLAKEIGGDDVSITTLMGVGVDPHSYKPRPSDTNALSRADLIIINGLHLEAKLGDVLESSQSDKLLIIGDFIPKGELLQDEDNVVDPHIWFDVENWKLAAKALADKLISLDNANSKAYQARVDEYLIKLDELNSYVINKVMELPKEKRILITAHDAFQYFANAYGFEVYSIQGISTETEPSAKDIQDLANLTVRLDVKAIFVESSIPENTINSVINAARVQGHDVKVGGELFSDSLGSESDGADTYIKMVQKNTDMIVNGLK